MKVEMTNLNRSYATDVKTEAVKPEVAKVVTSESKVERETPKKQEATEKDLETLKKGTFNERKQALKNLTHDETGAKDPGKAISAANSSLLST